MILLEKLHAMVGTQAHLTDVENDLQEGHRGSRHPSLLAWSLYSRRDVIAKEI
jgi:hypothetical protein